MVGFTLNEEQEALRSTVEDFARAEVAPVIGDYYERGEFPYPIVAKMGKLGLFGLPFPEEYGGMGGDYFAFCLALHELARVDSSVAITLEAAVGLGAMPIYRFGSAAQREEWLPPLCRGERLAAFGLTEPGGGSDIPGGMRTTARLERRRVGDRRVQGVHHQLGHLDHLGGDGAGHHRPGRAAGRRSPRSWSRPGRRASRSAASTPRSGGAPATPGSWPSPAAGCPRATCWASPAAATPSSWPPWMKGRVAIAALSAGLAQGCVDECLRYVGERTAFGHHLGHYQAIQFKIADMDARARLAQLAWYDAVAAMLAGGSFKQQAAIAKLTASEAAMDNARDATQIFGGYGFMNEFPVARFYRDAKVLEIGEGTSEVQRMIIARELGLSRESG